MKYLLFGILLLSYIKLPSSSASEASYHNEFMVENPHNENVHSAEILSHNKEFLHSKDILSLETIFALWRYLEIPYWCQLLLFIVILSIFENQLISFWKRANEIKSFKFSYSVLYKIGKILLGVILLVLGFPLYIPIFIILFTVKKIVMTILYHNIGDTFTELSGFDTFFAVSAENPIINGLAKFEGQPNEQKYYEHITKMLNITLENGQQPFRRFRQLLQCSYCYYIFRDAEDFDLKNHIKSVDLTTLYGTEDLSTSSKSEESSCSNKMICKYLNDNGGNAFPDHLPKWEIVFLTYGNASEYTLLFRLHHSIGDGLSILRMLLETLSDQPTKISLLGPPMHPLKKLITNIWSIFLIPFGMLCIFIGKNNPLHGPTLTGNSIYVTSKPISFESVKSIKRKMKASAVEVLFSSLSSSLASFFERRGYEIPEVGLLFPIGFEDLNSPVTLSNTFSMGMLAMPTPSKRNLKSSQDSSNQKYIKYPYIQRLTRMKQTFKDAMGDPTILSLNWISGVVGSMPSFLCKLFARSQGKTMVVSNVPGPHHDVSVLGRKLKELSFWLPHIPPTGLCFGFITYKGFLRVSYHVDRALIEKEEDAEQIMDDFIKALDGLEAESNALTSKPNSV